MNKVIKEVGISDEDHIWIDGKQFISLRRFIDLRTDQLNEMDILSDEIDRLYRENEAYKNLLKEKLEV